MKITLCIPMYNEQQILPNTLSTVSAYMKKNFAEDYEIIYIDDGSKDHSAALVKQYQQEDSRVRLISYAQNRGKGYAVRTGVLESQGDIVVFTDCDLAYGMDVIKEMSCIFDHEPKVDVVVGSRVKHPEGYEGYTCIRKLTSRAYIRILSLVGGVKLSDFQCGCKGFRSQIAKKIFKNCIIDRFAFDLEALQWAQENDAIIAEMPVKIINHRESSIHLVRDSMRMLKDIRRMKKHRKKLLKKDNQH